MVSSDDSLLMIPEDRDSNLHERCAILQKQFKKPAHSMSTGMHLDGQTKFLSHHFSESFAKKNPVIELLMLTDVQFGHKCCKVDKFIEYRDWILAEPNRYCLWGGDLLDGWRIGSPGAGYDNLFMPESQFYKLCELLAPIQHRVLGFVGGNHERRALAGGADWGSLIAFAMNVPYSAGGQMIGIQYGKHQPFPIYLWHGRGAARTAGAQVNMTLSAVPNDEALAYFSGHIHNSHCKVQWRMKRDQKNMKMVPERYYVVSASSFLEHYGSYNEVFGGTYSGLHMPVLLIHADGRYRVEL